MSFLSHLHGPPTLADTSFGDHTMPAIEEITAIEEVTSKAFVPRTADLPRVLLQPVEIDSWRPRDFTHRVRAQMESMTPQTNRCRFYSRLGKSGTWLEELREFTQRNAGRYANLEVDGTPISGLVEVAELPFLGADYDKRDGRVEIMLHFIGSDRHVMRRIPNPTSVSFLKGQDGADSVLCVTYDGGQALLSFSS
jgi:hypothetical protein